MSRDGIRLGVSRRGALYFLAVVAGAGFGATSGLAFGGVGICKPVVGKLPSLIGMRGPGCVMVLLPRAVRRWLFLPATLGLGISGTPVVGWLGGCPLGGGWSRACLPIS